MFTIQQAFPPIDMLGNRHQDIPDEVSCSICCRRRPEQDITCVALVVGVDSGEADPLQNKSSLYGDLGFLRIFLVQLLSISFFNVSWDVLDIWQHHTIS